MGNQAGKQKGDADLDSSGGDEKLSRKEVTKKYVFGSVGRPTSGNGAAGGATQPVDVGGQNHGAAGGGAGINIPRTGSPGTSAVPVPSPSNAPIAVPMAAGREVPYKRSKGTIEEDSEEEEEGNTDRKAFDSKNQKKVSLEDFEPLKVIGNGCFGKVMMVKFKKTDKIYAMKSIRKAHVVKNNKVRHTLAERNIMQKITHPFVMKLHYAFQNNGKLYMIMDYLNGGDIFYHLSISRRFNEERARFYTAEVLMALECLHEHGFIYRDLKPENVLTDSDGHIRLTDFGLSKESFEEGDAMTTFVGTTEYLAPEVLKQKGYGKEVDWWSLGVLVFEMLTGCPPFYSKNRQMTFRMILSAELNIPEWISPSAKALVRELLVREPSQRLGSGTRGAADIKRHQFFATLDFPALYRKEVPPPYIPAPLAHDDTSNFDTRFTAKPAEDSPTQSPEEASAFDNFSYQSPNFRGKSMMDGSLRNGSYRETVGSFGRNASYSSNAAGSFRGGNSLRGRSSPGGSGGASGGKKMLPRINSGEVLSVSEPRHSNDHDDAVLVPTSVQEDSELLDDSNESGSDTGAAGGGQQSDLESSVDSSGVRSDDDAELLGSSLIQSSLADKTPRWRQHDSEKAAAEAAGKLEARFDSSDEGDAEPAVAADDKAGKTAAAAGQAEAGDGDEEEEAGVSPTTPAEAVTQFGFEEEEG